MSWAGPSVAQATVLVEVPIDDMIADADAIAVAQVAHVGTRLVLRQDGELEPWTATTLRVERWLGGGAGTTVVVHERGGLWQGGGMRIAGTPEYHPGERVVVFLRLDETGRYRTYGMVQGKFVIRAGVAGVLTTVERDFTEVAFATWSSSGMVVQPRGAQPLPLDLLLERIRYVLEVSP